MTADSRALRLPDGNPSAAWRPEVELGEALDWIDRDFGIERLLADSHSDFVASYYRQSLPGYSALYNRWQCMHLPLQGDPHDGDEGWFAQADAVSALLDGRPGQRVLELGCGLGANALHLAARHPQTEVLGLDLMAQHVARATARAQGLPNARFRQGSFEALPADLGTFDAVLAVETLCYARDPVRVAAGIARLLRPGGRLVFFDAHRRADFAAFPAPLGTATRLYEVATAVTRGFRPEGTWERALTAAGLSVRTEDITLRTRQGLLALQHRSRKAFTDPRWRLALRLMPRYLARNAVAGLLGYPVCFGTAGTGAPQGPVAYQKILAAPR